MPKGMWASTCFLATNARWMINAEAAPKNTTGNRGNGTTADQTPCDRITVPTPDAQATTASATSIPFCQLESALTDPESSKHQNRKSQSAVSAGIVKERHGRVLFAGSSTNDLSRSTQFGASFLSIAICIDLRQEFRQRGGLRAMGEHGQVQRVPPEQTLVPVSQVFPFGLQPVRALVLGVGALALGIGTLLSIELGPQQPEVLGFGDLGNRHPARRVQLARARSLRPRHPSHGTPRGTPWPPLPPCMPMPYHHERQPPRATRACMHGIPHEVKETLTYAGMAAPPPT